MIFRVLECGPRAVSGPQTCPSSKGIKDQLQYCAPIEMHASWFSNSHCTVSVLWCGDRSRTARHRRYERQTNRARQKRFVCAPVHLWRPSPVRMRYCGGSVHDSVAWLDAPAVSLSTWLEVAPIVRILAGEQSWWRWWVKRGHRRRWR